MGNTIYLLMDIGAISTVSLSIQRFRFWGHSFPRRVRKQPGTPCGDALSRPLREQPGVCGAGARGLSARPGGRSSPRLAWRAPCSGRAQLLTRLPQLAAALPLCPQGLGTHLHANALPAAFHPPACTQGFRIFKGRNDNLLIAPTTAYGT